MRDKKMKESRNIKMQVFVTPSEYNKLLSEAKRLNLENTSDSVKIVRILRNLFEEVQDQERNIHELQDKIQAFNRIIQEKEAVISKYAEKKRTNRRK